MGKTIEMDDRDLTYMLGFLTPEHWASAIRVGEVDRAFATELLKIQDRKYGGAIEMDVVELLAMSKEEFALHMRHRRPAI